MTDAAGKGLEGVIAAQSSVCSIDGERGVLRYRGYSIDELASQASFEEVAYLLWNGDAPTREQLTQFRRDLAAELKLPLEVLDLLRAMPRGAHPMAALRSAFSLLGHFDPDAEARADDLPAARRKATRIQAQMTLLVPAWHRIRTGRPVVPPRPELSLAANFLLGASGEIPPDAAVSVFDQCLTLHADHELNASTFTCRVIAATLSDMHSAIAGGIGALKGPLHGGANTQVMHMLQEIDRQGGVERADAWVRAALEQKRKISGFGHRVYRTDDPRALHLKKLSASLAAAAGDARWYDLSVAVEEAFRKHKDLPANVDFYSASTYHMLGIPADLFTPVFAVSRTAGWLAHMLEQYSDNRLIRPRAEYTGVAERHLRPLDARG
jgi:citrate synthase